MLRKQLFVAIGMIAAVVTLLVLWLLLRALALFAGIAVVANQRFFVTDAIDGARTSKSRLIEITLR